MTIDTSFISLRLVIPAVLALVAPRAEIVALIKPQFEVGKGKVGKGGVVKDEKLRRKQSPASSSSPRRSASTLSARSSRRLKARPEIANISR